MSGYATEIRGYGVVHHQFPASDRDDWAVVIGPSSRVMPWTWEYEPGLPLGTYLDPDEADELAAALSRAANWARAQNLVRGHREHA